jgi:hypothetical protein
MNRKAWTANPLPAGLLLLALGVPSAFAAATAADAAPQAPPAGGDTKPAAAPPVAGAAGAAGGEHQGPETSPEATIVPSPPPPKDLFLPDPTYPKAYDPAAQLAIYNGKHMDATTTPPIQEGIRLYDRGAYEPRPTWLGAKNPIGFHFLAYGDLRAVAADNDNGKKAAANGKTDQSQLAGRLNLDLDMAFTATERIHAFLRPLDQGGAFTRYDIDGQVKNKGFQEFNSKIVTLFFEGDIGNILAGWRGRPSTFDIPISFGLVPITTQNGIWIQDAFTGGAIALTAKSSRTLDISNFDLTLFGGFDRVTTAAVPVGKARVVGLAGFADLLHGYLEFGYGYTDADVKGLSYHNLTAAFSKRRFKDWVSNSVRLIGNFGQTAPVKTADGLLILVENSLISRRPLVLVPYLNLFAGINTPQSLARAADVGGVLVNTGINFQSDGVTGYPTLDATARKSVGGALGVEYLFDLQRQIVVETAALGRTGTASVQGKQYALGASYQQPIPQLVGWIVRVDGMRGWLEGQKDIFGVRLEFRRKF